MLLTDSQFQVFLRAQADLHNLSRAEREAFLRALSGDDITTIAEKLQVRPEAIRQRLSQVYQKFEIGGKGPVKLAKLQQRLQIRYQEQLAGGETLPMVAKRQKRDRPRWDWGEAPDVPTFYGRQKELEDLQEWIVEEKCRLLALVGLAGIGKTALARKLAEKIQEEGSFDRLIWRSLRSAPTLEKLLEDLLECLGHFNTDRSIDIETQISQLVEGLRQSRCLLVLDDFESILQGGTRLQPYLEGYESYGMLLRQVGELDHQSCLLLNSYEKPREIASLERSTKAIRSLQLDGLNVEEAENILKDQHLEKPESWKELIDLARGNPLLLNIESAYIFSLFQGNVTEFLSLKTWIFEESREGLDRHFEKFSRLEKKIACHLASQSNPVSFQDIKKKLDDSSSNSQLIEELRSLQNRSWLEVSQNKDASKTFYELPKILKKYVEKYQLSDPDTM
ncbi:MAG: NB-ARC domain-containing protein [Geitlerinemataceae cyanobacterium]